MKNTVFLIFGLLLLSVTGLGQQSVKLPPLAVSANHRYLTAGGRPFFWLGDTGWLMLGKLNRQETEKYLDDRRTKGFNVVQVMLLHTLGAKNARGDSALVGKNPAKPRMAPPGGTGYWEYLDDILDVAASKGIYLALVPLWGSNVKSGWVSREQAAAYAGFLASRYRDKSNVVWMNGGDIHGDDSMAVWQTIGQTLKKNDPGHLVTFHPFGRTQSSKWFHREPWLDFNMFQSGHRDYAQDTARIDLRYGEDNWRYVEADYRLRPAKPTLDGEPSYEGIPHGLHDTLQPRWTADDLRRYAYWSAFSGACGFTYGNNSVMQMHKPTDKGGSYGARENWDSAINNPGAGQMQFLKKLMEKYRFQNLVPDQAVLVNPGVRYDHQVALNGKDCLLVYTWNGRAITLRRGMPAWKKFGMQWYNPRNGQFVQAQQMDAGKPLQYDPPGETRNGNDWVLVIEKLK